MRALAATLVVVAIIIVIFFLGFESMNKQCEMIARNVNDMAMDAFNITGFSDMLAIENAKE